MGEMAGRDEELLAVVNPNLQLRFRSHVQALLPCAFLADDEICCRLQGGRHFSCTYNMDLL